MNGSYELTRLTHLDGRFIEVDVNGYFDSLRRKEFGDLFLIDDEFNRGIFRDYLNFQSDPSFRHGLFFLDDICVSDPWGLVRSRSEKKIYNLTPGFGWMPDHFQHLISKGEVVEGALGRFSILHDNASDVVLSGLTALLSFPGALTFGHWIVDLWGRVETLKRTGLFYQVEHFLVPSPVSEWMYSFFSLFNIEASALRPLDRKCNYICRNLCIPTVPSQSPGGILQSSVFGRQIRNHSQFVYRWFPKPDNDWVGPLFLQHTPLTSDRSRTLGNSTDVENLINARGGRVVNPVKMAFGDLLQLIRQSSIVIGQDSSALHNVAFVGKDLISIETVSRRNMLHVSLQDILDKRVAYLQSVYKDACWKVDINQISDLLSHSLRQPSS